MLAIFALISGDMYNTEALNHSKIIWRCGVKLAAAAGPDQSREMFVSSVMKCLHLENECVTPIHTWYSHCAFFPNSFRGQIIQMYMNHTRIKFGLQKFQKPFSAVHLLSWRGARYKDMRYPKRAPLPQTHKHKKRMSVGGPSVVS